MRGVFVTGTDTGVGKSVLSAAIVAALLERGVTVAACKPVVSGLDEPAGEWPLDHELLASLTGQAPEQVSPDRFGPAVSPHLAAELAGVQLGVERLVESVRSVTEERAEAVVVVVEGVGGLLVPLGGGALVRDLAVALGLPVVVAARPGLGTINHTLLTLEAARASALDVRAVVLTPWPREPDRVERSNAATIEALGGVAVVRLPYVAAPTREALARAGARLPVDEWL